MEKGAAKKPIKREFSAGGVVFKKDVVTTFWLITKSAPSDRIPKPVWRLPKGWIDDKAPGVPGELASGLKKATEIEIQQAALREVAEEAGVEAKIIEKLGTVRFFFRLQDETILKFVTYYLMEWRKDLPAGHGDETQAVEWLTFEEAYKKLKYPSEKSSLKKANEVLSRGLQENLL